MGANKSFSPIMGTLDQIQFSIPYITNATCVNPSVAKSRLVKRTAEEIKSIRNPAYKYLVL